MYISKPPLQMWVANKKVIEIIGQGDVEFFTVDSINKIYAFLLQLSPKLGHTLVLLILWGKW